MVFLPNLPEADKSLRHVQKNNPWNIKYMPACPVKCEAYFSGVIIFFTCLDLEKKSSVMDGH
jgi:hypothetical protein